MIDRRSIQVQGPEGAGKTTLIERLAESAEHCQPNDGQACRYRAAGISAGTHFRFAVDSHQVIVLNVRSDQELTAAMTILPEIARIRKGKSIFDDVVGGLGDQQC